MQHNTIETVLAGLHDKAYLGDGKGQSFLSCGIAAQCRRRDDGIGCFRVESYLQNGFVKRVNPN